MPIIVVIGVIIEAIVLIIITTVITTSIIITIIKAVIVVIIHIIAISALQINRKEAFNLQRCNAAPCPLSLSSASSSKPSS